MRRTVLTLSALSLAFGATPAMSAGCLKGAAVGGVAGHFVGKGHAVIGAMAGCAIGHHHATVARRQAAQAQQAGQPVPVRKHFWSR